MAAKHNTMDLTSEADDGVGLAADEAAEVAMAVAAIKAAEEAEIAQHVAAIELKYRRVFAEVRGRVWSEMA
jgi:hypothetical protein